MRDHSGIPGVLRFSFSLHYPLPNQPPTQRHSWWVRSGQTLTTLHNCGTTPTQTTSKSHVFFSFTTKSTRAYRTSFRPLPNIAQRTSTPSPKPAQTALKSHLFVFHTHLCPTPLHLNALLSHHRNRLSSTILEFWRGKRACRSTFPETTCPIIFQLTQLTHLPLPSLPSPPAYLPHTLLTPSSSLYKGNKKDLGGQRKKTLTHLTPHLTPNFQHLPIPHSPKITKSQKTTPHTPNFAHSHSLHLTTSS